MSLIKIGGGREGDLIVADYQTGGKGQRGNRWISEPGQNLLFSFVLQPDFLETSKMYLLNVAMSVGIIRAVTALLPEKKVEIKWPNDIYLNGKKIAGMLIETARITGHNFAVVGIGLNVNQQTNLSSGAVSLAQVQGKSFDLFEVLESVLVEIEEAYLNLRDKGPKGLMFYYHENMYWRGEIHSYQLPDGEIFEGEIIGINEKGLLAVKQEQRLLSFDVKQVRFIA